MRRNPAAFPDTRAVVRRSGFGVTRLFELFRLHYHSTPADLLLRARIEAAKRSLVDRKTVPRGRPASDPSILEIAASVGFESVSVFHEHFRRLNGLTPATYRDLRTGRSFTIDLPEDYPLGYLRRALSRDGQSITDKLAGDRYTSAVQLGRGPAILQLQLTPTQVHAEIVAAPDRCASDVAGEGPAPLPEAVEAHAVVVGLLGLDQDAAAFSRLARKLGLARLVAGRPELRIAQTPSIFDGLLWSIIGQQINFAFACVLKRRLIERAGVKLEHDLYAPPTPQAVAALEPADLAPLQFSRSKAEYIIATARRITNGELNLDALRTMSATRVERTLLGVRGLGPWSVNYLMMRALGFADCVPLGDTGVTSGLQAALKLDERPDIDATRRLMSVFSPYRSLATAHLWQFNQPIP
jgi:AraC family transcriptional regulator of adaptative response / DNA-3-methyladenine glycosylase II